MKIVYYECKNFIELWDIHNLKRFKFPLMESQAKTEKNREFIKKILTSNKDALLNLKHKHKNIRILCYYKILYNDEILPVSKNFYTDVLFGYKQKTNWMNDRNEARKANLIFGG